jgi:hypothetical protein
VCTRNKKPLVHSVTASARKQNLRKYVRTHQVDLINRYLYACGGLYLAIHLWHIFLLKYVFNVDVYFDFCQN